VLAVETSIRLWSQSPPRHHRLAIRPYPQALEEDFALRTGPLVQLRPIRPENEPEHVVFFSKLRLEDIQLRFFGSFSKFHHPVLARFTQIDYDQEMAFSLRESVVKSGDVSCQSVKFKPQRTQRISLRSSLWFERAFATPSPGEGGGEGEIQKLRLCRMAV